MTEFRKLAEAIAQDIMEYWCCTDELPDKESEFFEEWFKPTPNEIIEYNHLRLAWMRVYEASISDNNNLHILALLFAEQLWLDIKEGER